MSNLISVPERIVDAARENGQYLIKVQGGYALLSLINHEAGTPYRLMLLSGKTETVEVREYLAAVSVSEGPTLSWDLPEWDPSANAGGWFIDTVTAEFVLCQQSTDYGNGPGRAVATIVRRVKALRSAE